MALVLLVAIRKAWVSRADPKMWERGQLMGCRQPAWFLPSEARQTLDLCSGPALPGGGGG